MGLNLATSTAAEPATRAVDAAPSRRRDTPGMAHLRALDGLRGVAVLAVVLYHFSPGVAPGGFLGVDLFFALSGFLITSLLVYEWDAKGAISLPAFWGRRARRLLPALFLVLGAVGVYALVLSNRVDGHNIAEDGLAAFTYVANWHFIASGQSYIQQLLHQTASPLRHMWSLAIEEQFYLVWPLLVLLVGNVVARRTARVSRRRRQFRRVLVTVCLTLAAASLLRMITLYHPGGDPNRVYYGTDSRAFVLLFGAALGALTAGAPTVRRLRGLLVVVGTVGALALVGGAAWLTITSSWLYEGGYGVVAVVMVVLLAAAAQPGPNPLARLLETRPLVALGIISYGVYLWHWPVALWLTPNSVGLDGPALFAARSALTLAAALASYVLVEQPIRTGRFPHWWHIRPSTLTLIPITAVAVVLLIPALAFPSVQAAPTVGTLTKSAVGVTATYAQAPRCDAKPGSGSLRPGSPLRIQLVGNSLAGEVTPCLRSILHARGATLESLSPNGGSFCAPHAAAQIQDQLRNPATHPDAAVLFAFVAYEPTCAPWMPSVDRLVANWKAAGTHVYLVPSVPFVPGSSGDQVAGSGPAAEAAYYRILAARDPARITVLDAGTFLRDANGVYPWGMPCLPGGEPGCDTHHIVGVRYTDGLHYCTDPDYAAHGCVGAVHQGGERRAAAALASGLIAALKAGHPNASQRSR